jgi:hypothetical protein
MFETETANARNQTNNADFPRVVPIVRVKADVDWQIQRNLEPRIN